MSNKIEAIVIGSGPVASLIAGSIDRTRYCTAWLCFPDKEKLLKDRGLFIQNHEEKVIPVLPNGILHSKDMPSGNMLFNEDHLEQEKLHVYSTPLPPENIDISDDVIIFFTTKSYDNPKIINQVKPVLEAAKNSTIVSIQNGIAPESRINDLIKNMGLNTNVVRGVPMGPCTFISPGKLMNGIFRIDFGHWNAEVIGADEHIKLSEKIGAMFDLINGESKVDFKTVSASKALANLINSNALIFASNCDEAINARFMHELFQAKANEGIMVFRGYGAGIKSLSSLDVAYSMLDTTRSHLPSMGRDPFVIYEGGKDFPFQLRTEIDDIDTQIAHFGDDLKIVTFWNSLCSDLVHDFCNTFNEIREKADHDLAVEFGIRFVTRNRHIAGLEPYIIDRWYGHEFPSLKGYEEQVKKKFSEIDTNLDQNNDFKIMHQAIYLCGHLANPGTKLGSLSDLIIESYKDLKYQYHKHISDIKFNIENDLCSRYTHCTTPCYSLFNR